MRNAPPVLVPVGRFVWGARVTLALALLSAALPGATWLWLAPRPGQLGWWLLAWSLASLACLAWVRREALPAGELRWDGHSWLFVQADAMEVPVQPRVIWDLGSAMLVGVSAATGGWRGMRFAWLNAANMPQQWHGWRCAVYSGSDNFSL